MRDSGAVFIQDLITAEDREFSSCKCDSAVSETDIDCLCSPGREFGAWELVFTDVMGILEQSLLSRSTFIYGHALSSV